MKALRNLKIQFGSNSDYQRRNIHKHSIYMQSRDSTWLNRNLKNGKQAEMWDEPIEEDIRD